MFYVVYFRCCDESYLHLKYMPGITITVPQCRTMNGGSDLPSVQDAESTAHFLESVFSSPEISVLSSEAKCQRFVKHYNDLNPEEKLTFLKVLSKQYGVHQDSVVLAAQGVTMAKERGEAALLKSEERLRNSLVPRFQQLFQKIGRIEGGVKFLVNMRADILTKAPTIHCEKELARLRVLQNSIRELLTFWFSVGFLKLQRITWESSCDMVQKVSDYEAVHPIRNWADLKRRVGTYRRCFVFTHKSMPKEPVVVLHTALTQDISKSIHSIISTPSLGQVKQAVDSPPAADTEAETLTEDQSKISAAVFYSITSTQKGLQSVDLGNYLIKKAVEELQTEFPGIHKFSSLSPIPGFKDWLITEINKSLKAASLSESVEPPLLYQSEIQKLREIVEPENANMVTVLKGVLQNHTWVSNEHVCQVLQGPLTRLCARYLYTEKRRGYALNPVANFHLSNGAVLWRINWLGDMSMRGINQSCGMMVNYRYFLESTEENSRKYLELREITASEEVKEWAKLTL
ncbi:malonyl-CoA decarboxylase, mitochondrial-like isoform X2 [Mizuhopecten yessoensis]|uniref:malonyl-CoA decarboxylase, mitochondrial-like isoform X2 n=1 Tax=Mizuhopecten yessoensis TaxID=6573 RepID=UPI000B45EBE1|nr:malonyl-CoA decarboxylase, mitochondrial-like isoform X2 [Mizuhopecten yessoensis]